MTASYRTVYFRPRLGLDWRVPIAALFSAGGATEAIPAELLPDPRCLGGIGASELLRFGVAVLATVGDDSLPSSLGPHFEIGPSAELPRGVENPVRWIKSTALPHPMQVDSDNEVEAEKRVGTKAWNLLSNWGVSGYVRKRFRSDQNPELHRLPPKIGSITHYVQGDDLVLLMEPIALSGAGVEERIAKVHSKFSSYARAWDDSAGRHHRRLAYILPGPQAPAVVATVMEQLRVVADVYDTGSTRERSELTSEIRRVGDSGPERELVG
jgi:hypothetical protein